MRTIRRIAIGTTLTGMAASVSLLSFSAPAAGTPAVVGNLAYIAPTGALETVQVSSDGTTSTPFLLGPVTSVPSPKTVKVTDLVVSDDDTRLGWSEVISKPDPTYGSIETGAVLVVRNLKTAQTTTLRSGDIPLGFVGDQLVVVGAHTARLVIKPMPHLVRVPEGNAYPLATYPHGLVDAKFVGQLTGSTDHEQLRLSTLSGRHTVLHTYVVGTTYRNIVANLDAVSPDGEKLLVERGNHQDFNGLGPNSLFDSYSLAAGHARTQLGHYGSNKMQWRQAGATFSGPHDSPWLALHSGFVKTASGLVVHGAVVHYVNGHWADVAPNGISVTGNAAGYVAIQFGSWQPVPKSPDGEYQPVPAAQAELTGPGGTHALSVEGTQLLWIS